MGNKEQFSESQFEVTQEALDQFLEQAKTLADKYKITLECVIKAKKALELERQNRQKLASLNQKQK